MFDAPLIFPELLVEGLLLLVDVHLRLLGLLPLFELELGFLDCLGGVVVLDVSLLDVLLAEVDGEDEEPEHPAVAEVVLVDLGGVDLLDELEDAFDVGPGVGDGVLGA